jgi:hypothetical protein
MIYFLNTKNPSLHIYKHKDIKKACPYYPLLFQLKHEQSTLHMFVLPWEGHKPERVKKDLKTFFKKKSKTAWIEIPIFNSFSMA